MANEKTEQADAEGVNSKKNLHIAHNANRKQQQAPKRETYPITDLENGIIAWERQDDPLNPR